MRTIDPEPDHPLNQATIVMHTATNQARLWEELKAIKTAGRDYYSNLISKVPQAIRNRNQVFRRPNAEWDIFHIHGQKLGEARMDSLVSWKERFERMAIQGRNQGMTPQEIKTQIQASLAVIFGTTAGAV